MEEGILARLTITLRVPRNLSYRENQAMLAAYEDLCLPEKLQVFVEEQIESREALATVHVKGE